MNIVAVEYGERPRLLTKARRFAPEGVKVLADLLGHLTFADDGLVVLDWNNALGLQPDEAAKPVIIIRAAKVVSDVVGANNLLTIEVRLDVDDLFGKDQIQAEDFLDIVQQMEAKMMATISQRKDQ